MKLRDLATFQAVARHLSFTRAAAELNYAQPALTAHVKALEAELGVQLFDRLGRRIALTAEGESLLGYAEEIIELVREATTVVAPQRDRPRAPFNCSIEQLNAAPKPGA
ncbi:MAG: LysR family transcriptional regulator [Streptosporangiaceae bacterium]